MLEAFDCRQTRNANLSIIFTFKNPSYIRYIKNNSAVLSFVCVCEALVGIWQAIFQLFSSCTFSVKQRGKKKKKVSLDSLQLGSDHPKLLLPLALQDGCFCSVYEVG